MFQMCFDPESEAVNHTMLLLWAKCWTLQIWCEQGSSNGSIRESLTVGVHFGELEDGLMDLGSDPGVN